MQSFSLWNTLFVMSGQQGTRRNEWVCLNEMCSVLWCSWAHNFGCRYFLFISNFLVIAASPKGIVVGGSKKKAGTNIGSYSQLHWKQSIWKHFWRKRISTKRKEDCFRLYAVAETKVHVAQKSSGTHIHWHFKQKHQPQRPLKAQYRQKHPLLFMSLRNLVHQAKKNFAT